MKIGERFHDDDGTKFVVQKTFDPNPTLESARLIRNEDQRGDWRHVGRIPGWLYWLIMKQEGVAVDDVPAQQEVLRKKLLSGDLDAFRNWRGTF